MSMESIITEAKDAAENGFEWLRKLVDEHLPAAIAEAKKVVPEIAAEIEAAAGLNPAEVTAVVSFIRTITGMRSQPASGAPAETPAEPAPAEGDQSAA